MKFCRRVSVPLFVFLLVLSLGAGPKNAAVDAAECQRSGLTIQTSDVSSPAASRLTFGSWEYREVSTRPSWWIGCWLYDFLQASGIFPVTWLFTIEPLVGSTLNSWVYLIDRSTYAGVYCAAQPDQVNFLRVRYDEENLSGGIRIVPDFSVTTTEDPTMTEVTCAPSVLGIIDSPLGGDLQCELVRLPWTGRECLTINVKLEGV